MVLFCNRPALVDESRLGLLTPRSSVLILIISLSYSLALKVILPTMIFEDNLDLRKTKNLGSAIPSIEGFTENRVVRINFSV